MKACWVPLTVSFVRTRNSSPVTASSGGTAPADLRETDGYDEMVILKNIRFESYCEHHMVPIIGRAHVAYLPKTRVVGIRSLPASWKPMPSGFRSRRR